MDPNDILFSLAAARIPYRRKKTGEHVYGRIVWGITLFMRDPNTAEAHARAIPAIEHLRETLPVEVYSSWRLYEDTRYRSAAKTEIPNTATLAERSRTDGSQFFIEMTDAEDARYDAAGHAMTLSMHGSVDPGVLHLAVPLDWIETQSDGWAFETFHALCEIMHPRFGWSGYTLTVPADQGARQQNTGLVHELLRRFPGINSMNPLHFAVASDAFETDAGLPTIDWLTAIDSATLDRCGGHEAARGSLGTPEAPVYVHDHGIVIQAGPHPETGDRELDAIPPSYSQVASFLRPARILDTTTVLNPVYASEGTEFDVKRLIREQVEWLTRFDA